MTNNFTLENTKDATHVYLGEYGIQFANNNGYINDVIDCMNNREHSLSGEHDTGVYDLDLTDQTGRGYPTLEWFLKCGMTVEYGDSINGADGTYFVSSITEHDEPSKEDSELYVIDTHDNRHDLTAMARDEYYAKRENQWPDNSRIDAIGQNGNNGEHYPHESESPLSPNFEIKPVYTQEMHDNGELPPVGSECLIMYSSSNYKGTITYMGDGVGCYHSKDNNKEYTFSFNAVKFKPLDTRTDQDKLRDAISSIVAPLILDDDLSRNVAVNLMAKFTITLNEEG